jgi:hypothetical protein
MTILGSIATVEVETEAAERAIPTAELVECNCPDVCDRDHDTD